MRHPIFRTLAVAAVAILLGSGPAAAMQPDDELWIPAAARGAGSSGSFWLTDLVILNLGDGDLTLELTWLERGADNGDAGPVTVDLGGGETLVVEDVVMTTFGLAEAAGAIRVEVLEDDDGDTADGDDPKIVASARIYNVDDDETFGQGFEGLVSDAAISDESDPTHSIGVADTSAFRTNWFGLNISMDDDDEPEPAEVMVELLDADGAVLASREFTMPPLAPMLRPVSALGAGDVEHATLRFTMLEGEGLFGASMVDEGSNDPTTLESHWDCGGDAGDLEYTDEFPVDDCTFATTGRNPFWIPLEPGYSLELEGEEDDEELTVTITVLDETFVVDGVETRVIEEVETADDELTEISRNYFAFCVETASVYYFGEHVDIYDGGVVVGHEGEWLAGVDDAEPGIIMPGTVLLGSRYFQEVAPGVALDRAEHTAMGETIDVPAGVFEDCLRVDETTPLEPGDLSVKYYAPGVGLVVDDVLSLVAVTDPSAP